MLRGIAIITASHAIMISRRDNGNIPLYFIIFLLHTTAVTPIVAKSIKAGMGESKKADIPSSIQHKLNSKLRSLS